MTIAPTTPEITLEALLEDCARLGHRLVQHVVAEVETSTAPATKAATAYDRITRSIRRSIMLARQLAAPAKTINRTAARKRILREVEDAIQRETEHPDDADTLHAELLDRLDTPDFDADLNDRPIEHIITDIVRDLGLANSPGNHPWKRRTPADVAQLNAQAAQPTPTTTARSTPAWPLWRDQARPRPATRSSA